MYFVFGEKPEPKLYSLLRLLRSTKHLQQVELSYEPRSFWTKSISTSYTNSGYLCAVTTVSELAW